MTTENLKEQALWKKFSQACSFSFFDLIICSRCSLSSDCSDSDFCFDSGSDSDSGSDFCSGSDSGSDFCSGCSFFHLFFLI